MLSLRNAFGLDGAAPVFTERFDGPTNGQTWAAYRSALWSAVVGDATATIQNGKGRVTGLGTTAYQGGYVMAGGQAVMSNVDVSGNVAMAQSGVEQYVQMGIGSTGGYYSGLNSLTINWNYNATAASSTTQASKTDGANNTSNAGGAGPTRTLVGTTRYSFRFQYFGVANAAYSVTAGTFRYRIWVAGTAEPSIWDESVTGLTGYSGRVLLGMSNGGAAVQRQAEFDDVQVLDLTPAAAGTGDAKVYNGSAFVAKPVKVSDGTTWTKKPVKVWNGSAWVTTTY